MPRKTERVELDEGAWADMDVRLSTRAYGIAVDSIGQYGRVTHQAMKDMVIASTVQWSFGDVIDSLLDYEVNITQFNQMREKVLGAFLAEGGGIAKLETDEEKKDCTN